MKGNKKVLVAAVLLLLLAVSFGTYAIYRTNFAGNTTLKAAAWSAVLKDGNDASTTLDLTMADFDCGANQHGYNNTIAPGDTCTATVKVDLDGSQVDAEVTATVGTITGLDASRVTVTLMQGSPAADANGTAVDVPYSATEGEMEVEFVVTVAWAGDTDNLAENGKDVKDVAAQGQDIVIPITITAAQDMGA